MPLLSTSSSFIFDLQVNEKYHRTLDIRSILCSERLMLKPSTKQR